ncbi:MAG: phospholipid carrier-dependent glycosyltransferase [Anaerolineae bacterium]
MIAWVKRHRFLTLLLVITAVGLALRLYGLGALPYGFHPDEGYNALDALDILSGARPIFFERNNGREPLFIYFIATMVGLFGPTIWAVRLAGAIAGTLVIPAQYLLVQSLPIPRARLIGLVSAALLAVTFWPVHQAHKGLRAGMLPLWLALMLWAWWQAIRPERGDDQRSARAFAPWAWALAAGVFLALANYTYLLARLLPLVLVGSALWGAWQARRWRPLAQCGAALGVAAVLLIPLGLYFQQHPDMLLFRANQVSVLNPEVNGGDLVGTLAENGANLLLAFNWRGPAWWYENLSGRPVFDPLVGIAFLLGLGLLLWNLARPKPPAMRPAALLLDLTLVVTLIPSWLSLGAPTYIRMTATWPVIFLLPAWGLVWAAFGLAGWLREQPAMRSVRPPLVIGGVIGVALLLSAGLSYRDLFVRYAAAPQVYRGTRVATAENGQFIADMLHDGPVYVSPSLWVQPVIRFLNNDNPPGVFDPRTGLVLPPQGDVTYLFDIVEADDAAAFGQRWPQFEREDIVNSRGDLSLIAYHLPRDRWPGPQGTFVYPADGTFGDNIRLVGHDTRASVTAGKSLPVTLEWETSAPTELDINFFVHLVAADGRTIGQYDGASLKGSYLSSRWKPGERILETVIVPVAKDAPAGDATLRIGWYDWRDGQRLPVAGSDDASLPIAHVGVQK